MMMSNQVTIEQVEQLAMQLPSPEQLKLVARISEQLSGLALKIPPSGIEQVQREREAMADALLAELDAIAESIIGESETVEEHERQEYAQRVEAFLRMSDEMAAETIGEVDLTEDIRQIREERTARL